MNEGFGLGIAAGKKGKIRELTRGFGLGIVGGKREDLGMNAGFWTWDRSREKKGQDLGITASFGAGVAPREKGRI